jgi:hypothetical protein
MAAPMAARELRERQMNRFHSYLRPGKTLRFDRLRLDSAISAG